jgi:hypothetical protein
LKDGGENVKNLRNTIIWDGEVQSMQKNGIQKGPKQFFPKENCGLMN